MIFSLEAIQAKHGDALLLHYGEEGDPQLIVIDGGPAGVYKSRLKKRLEDLRLERTPDGALPIRLLMVSHIDDDHIRGVLDMTRGLVKLQENGQSLPYEIFTLWHNGFGDLVNDDPDTLFAGLYPMARTVALGGAPPAGLQLSRPGALVIASVGQGRDLLDDATLLDLELNHPFADLVAAPKKGRKTIKLGAGLSFTVLGPSEQRIEDLREEWEKQIEKIRRAGKKDAQARIAAFVDDSVFNLASIVVLATLGKRRMLLTGDARGDDILAGLKAALITSMINASTAQTRLSTETEGPAVHQNADMTSMGDTTMFVDTVLNGGMVVYDTLVTFDSWPSETLAYQSDDNRLLIVEPRPVDQFLRGLVGKPAPSRIVEIKPE